MDIRARDVWAGYGESPVLKGVDIALRTGEFCGIVGPNGSGKSTLLRVLSGAMPITRGEVRLGGVPIRRMPSRDRARSLAFVPQTEPTLFEFSVRDVVMMGRHAAMQTTGRPTERDVSIANRAMVLTDTERLADRPITAISGGEHRRVLIARAIAQDAPAILLDEPTAHLDITHEAEVLAILTGIASSARAVMCALHDLNHAAECCTRLVLMGGGLVLADGPPSEVLREDLLHRAYGMPVQVTRNPLTGSPLVLAGPRSPVASERGARVHVICGGGTGVQAMTALRREGYAVSAGVLNLQDTDEDAATALGIEHITEMPFTAHTEIRIAECRALVERSDAVVVTDVPVGSGNLANLRLALEAARAGKLVLTLSGRTPAERDHTGGPGALLLAELAGLSISVAGVDDLPGLIETNLPQPMTEN